MEKSSSENGDFVIKPQGGLTVSTAGDFDRAIEKLDIPEDARSVVIDLGDADKFDSYVILFLKSLESIADKRGLEIERKNMPDEMKRFVEVISKRKTPEEKPEEKPDLSFFEEYFTNVGKTIIQLMRDGKGFIEFLGELIIKTAYLIIRPGSVRWKDFPQHFTSSGVNAVPIVLLIVFLIGVISGYQAAVQLAQFGADIYVADLIGISITRELAPLMTAILVAGRSGSAFAAELGTMKVSDEIDALESMGFDTMRFLIMPRVMSVVLAMPFLTILADVAGVGGGMITAIGTLNITISGYLNELEKALSIADIFSGIIKSTIFGFLVATVGCFRGMQVRGGAESVGKFTTASVVTGVFLIILADAVFTFLFQTIGI
ncbi:MAG: MlaE family lipid ABC transporter permease subunit [Candidatus Kapaibacterium sp.]